MGKRRHVRAKSKLKFGKKKLRESRGHGKGEFRSEDDEACDWRKQKRNESIWKRWLAFFRGHWSLNATRDQSNAMALVREDARARPPKGDKFAWKPSPRQEAVETPTDGSGNFGVLTRSATNGLKPARAQHEAPSHRQEGTRRKVGSSRASEEHREHDCLGKCEISSYFPDYRGHRSAPSQIHNMFTSALFVRQYPKTVRESTDSEYSTFSSSDVNPETLADRINSGTSGKEEQQQQERGVEEREEFLNANLRKENEKNAFKTWSEPSWNEKNKLFQREKLQENLNDLIKQFVFLETDSLLGSYHSDLTSRSELESKLKKEKARAMLRACQFSGSLPVATNVTATAGEDGEDNEDDGDNDEDHDEVILRTEGLREVSPEILVNIKPFKEYMWKINEAAENPNQLEDEKPMRTSRKRRKPTEMGEIGCRHNFRVCKKSNIGKSLEKVCQKGSFGFQLKVCSLDETNADEHVAKSAQELRTSGGRTKTAGTASEGFLICDTEVDLLRDPLSCSVRGVYRSYTDLAEPPVFDKNESWEHVLDHFDDKNHNAIFRQNLNQFKTLIRCDGEPVRPSPPTRSSADQIPAHPEVIPLTTTDDDRSGLGVKQTCKTRAEVVTEDVADDEEGKLFLARETREPQGTDTAEKKGLPHRRLVILTQVNPSVCHNKRFFETVRFLLAAPEWTNTRTVATRTEMLFLKNWGFFREIVALTETSCSVLVEKMYPRLCSSHLVLVSKMEKPEFKSQESSTSSLVIGALGNQTNTVFTQSDTVECNKTENHETVPQENIPERFSEDCHVVVKIPDTLSLNRKLFLRSTDCFYLTDFEQAPRDKVACTLDPILEKAFCSTARPEDASHHAMSLYLVEVVHRTLQIFDHHTYNFIVEVRDSDSVSSFLSPAERGMSETEFIRKIPSKAKIFPSSSETFASSRRKEVCEYGPIIQAKDDVACTGKGKGMFTGRKFASEPPEQNTIRKLGPTCEKDGERFTRKVVCIREADVMGKDGFEILYNGLFKKCLDECENVQVAGPNFGKGNDAFDYGSVGSRFFGKDADGFQRLALLPVGNVGKKREDCKYILPEVRLLGNLEKATDGRFVKYKSSSSPDETAIPLEYRLKRFLHLTNELDKAGCQGPRLENSHHTTAGIGLRKTESICAVNKDVLVGSVLVSGSDTRNAAVDRERSENLQSPTRTESSPGTRVFGQRMFMFEKSRRDVTKEVAAALNSIRDFSRCREDFVRGTKRMSLVILLSKNK